MQYEMSYVELDPHTADRILAGVVAPDDSPPGWAHVVRLLDAAALGEQLVEHTARRTVANMAAVIERLRWPDEESQGGRVWQGRRRGSAAAVFVAATLTIAVGSAAAATTNPHAVEQLAARMLSGVGVGSSGHDPAIPPVSKPSPPASKAAGDHGRHRAVSGAQQRQNHAPRNQHGKAVSTVAHTDGLTGRAKGEAVSAVASGGNSHAGQPSGHANPGPTHQPTSASGNSGTRGTSAGHAQGVGAQGHGVGKQGKAGN